jgi:hypothetical protein
MSNIFKDNSIRPPQAIINALVRFFHNPLNIEWFKKSDVYEAIFYCDNKEYIAHLTLDGLVSDYKVNRPISELPQIIRSQLANRGEIMNVVSIHSGSKTRYEVIFRDDKLTRFVALFDNDGIETNFRPL